MDKDIIRLELFRQAINAQADADAAEIMRDADEKCAAVEREKSERSSNEALSELKAEQARNEAKFRKELSRCDFDTKKAVLAHRNALIEGFFDEIRARLADFTATPAYAEYLKNALAEVEKTLGGENTVIGVRAADIKAAEALTRLPVRQDDSIELGGISAENAKLGLFADYTLDSRFREEKAAFADKTELRL